MENSRLLGQNEEISAKVSVWFAVSKQEAF